MTNYGSIPTSSHPSPAVDLEYISRVKHRIKSGLSMRRPWRSMFDHESMSFPNYNGLSDGISRIKTNLGYFRANYAIGVLFILFLSLIYHPTSLIVFTILIVFWIFLYFLRDEPTEVFGYQIDDRMVLVFLSLLTFVFLMLTHATLNILLALLIAGLLVVIHAGLRRTDNLFLDEEATAATDDAPGLTSYTWS